MIDIKLDNVDDVKYLFERQQKELLQSLRYASYIQKALLTPVNTLERYFPEHFLLYIPRDIVSGDFYWATKKGSKIIIAVADCTGHGVPGAFLSILGISFLNQIVDRQEHSTPAGILNSLREYLMKALNQTGTESEQKDGIDMSLCILDNETNTLEFAGAFNPLYIFTSNKQLVEVNGDKMQIGIAADTERSFTNHILELKYGDMVYLFSDGFVDQFGGSEGKKYKYKPFRELLLRLSDKKCYEQKDLLIQTLNQWKGELPQLDDVLIFGFRYHAH